MPTSSFQHRRAQLLAQMQPGGIALLSTAPTVNRNADAEYPYRQDSYFYYLSGFLEPRAIIMLYRGWDDKDTKQILFCQERHAEKELWEGRLWGPAAAAKEFLFDHAFSIHQFADKVQKYLGHASTIYYPVGLHAHFDNTLQQLLNELRTQTRKGLKAPHQLIDLRFLLDEMRLFKDAEEIDAMQQAANISGKAHQRLMQMTRPGLREYQLEAELLHHFYNEGAQAVAYNSIVASGANACILHYRAGGSVLQDNELVLVDAGCEYRSYASDITRTFPVNGRFNAAQARLYQLVLDAQLAAIAAVKDGNAFDDPHQIALKILAEGMLEFNLLQKNEVGKLEDVLENGAYKRFYMHRTSHWLGLDVHDVGRYHELDHHQQLSKQSRILQKGMVLTVEPGIYIRPAEDIAPEYWNIGIRIEDDVLVTDKEPTVLSAHAPKTIADIEAMMNLNFHTAKAK